jgi:hypothetical protein
MAQDAGRIDFRPASRTLPTWNPERYGTIVQQPNGTPINPITGEAMDSFFKICNFMRNAGVSKTAFYGVGTMADINLVSVDVQDTFVEILNGNGSTFLITITSVSAAKCRTFWIGSTITSQVELNDTRYS